MAVGGNTVSPQIPVLYGTLLFDRNNLARMAERRTDFLRSDFARRGGDVRKQEIPLYRMQQESVRVRSQQEHCSSKK